MTSDDSQSHSTGVMDWIRKAREQIAKRPLSSDDLDELSQVIEKAGQLRQRLLYVHADSPSPRSSILSMYSMEPVRGGAGLELSTEPEFPYESVHEALIDGWQIVHFPDQRSPVSDRDIDIYGYEFVLQKLDYYS